MRERHHRARTGERGRRVGERVVAGQPGARVGRHQFPAIRLATALGHDEPVRIPAQVAVVVAEQIERDLGDRRDHATVGRESWMDRVAAARRARGHRRQLGGHVREAVGAEHRVTPLERAAEHDPPTVGRHRRLGRIGDAGGRERRTAVVLRGGRVAKHRARRHHRRQRDERHRPSPGASEPLLIGNGRSCSAVHGHRGGGSALVPWMGVRDVDPCVRSTELPRLRGTTRRQNDRQPHGST